MQPRHDALGIDRHRQRQLDPERPLTNADRVVDRAFRGGGRLTVSQDDERVLEDLYLEVVLVDAREVDDHLDRARRLVRVRVGPPPGLDEHSRPLARPDLAEGPHLTRSYRQRVSIAQVPVSHRSACRSRVAQTPARDGAMSASISESASHDPSWRAPLTKNVGVPFTPLRTPLMKSSL